MRKIFFFLALGAVLTLSSCVYSLFPFYTEDTIIYYEDLNGKWSYDTSTFLVFEPYYEKENIMIDLSDFNLSIKQHDHPANEDVIKDKEEQEENHPRSYKMTVKSGDQTIIYLTHLFEVEGSLYMDLFPWLEEGVHQVEGDKIVVDNLFPVHTIMKVELEGNKLNLIQFDLSKLHDLFKSNLIRLRHEMVNDEVLVTAKPREIQKFLKNYSKDPSVYGSKEEYTKVL